MTEIFIYTFLMGGLFTFFGWVIKSKNAGDMINFFDSQKYDKEKFSKIFGVHFLFIVIGVIFVGLAGLFFRDINHTFFINFQTAIVILGMIKTMYSALKHGKVESNI